MIFVYTCISSQFTHVYNLINVTVKLLVYYSILVCLDALTTDSIFSVLLCVNTEHVVMSTFFNTV